MLKWQSIDKSFLLTHRWVLMIWLWFIMFAFALMALTPYGWLNIYISAHYQSELGTFFRYFTHLGEEWLLIPVGIALIWFIGKLDFAIRLAATFVINTLFTFPVKHYVFETDRPRIALEKFHLVFTEGVEVYQYNSFPSGHTSAAFAMALAVALWFNSRSVSLLVVCMAVGVGMSRIYLQQHFIEDVAGGAFIGLCSAALASRFYWISKHS